MRLLDTPVAEIQDPDLLGLLSELRELRGGAFCDVWHGSVLLFLEAFFLPGDQRRFVPIGKANLSLEVWLLRRLSECRSSSVHRLCRELIALVDTRLDSADDPRVYSVLNAALAPLCRGMTRKRPRRRP